MTLFKFFVTCLVTSKRFSWSNELSFINIGSAIDARLQTAISSLEVYSIISVHKFEDLMVPKFFWLDFLFAASL